MSGLVLVMNNLDAQGLVVGGGTVREIGEWRARDVWIGFVHQRDTL